MKKLYWIIGICIAIVSTVVAFKFFRGEEPTEVTTEKAAKRNIIETVFDYLKNKMNLEHTRHRSPINAFVHILSTFISYCFKKNNKWIN